MTVENAVGFAFGVALALRPYVQAEVAYRRAEPPASLPDLPEVYPVRL